MCFFDDTFSVTREFFDETLDLIIDDIRPILLSPDEFKLVPVPFYKPKVYEDKDAGRRYETYTEVEYNTRRRFDIVLENSGIGHIQIYYCRPDQVHVTITKHRKIKERFPSEKIDRPAQEHLLDRLVEELCRIEPGHNGQSMQRVEIKTEKATHKKKARRPHLPDDLWAYKEMHEKGRLPDEVREEWLTRSGVKKRNLVDPKRQFEKLKKMEWLND